MRNWKESKYTYEIENDRGDLLLYNSMVGTKSLLKIKDCDSNRFHELISGKITSENNSLYELLLKKGILVEHNDNEFEKLKQHYLGIVGSNVLKITILPTEQCNFRCKYCYETFENKKMDGSTQEALIRYVSMNINRYQAMDVMWFGGEPLMAVDVIENLSNHFIEICKNNKKRYTAHMTTNGYALSSDMLEKLLKLNIFSYQITIDGLKENHDHQRVLANGKGTFETIFHNLKDIKNNCKNRHLDILLRTNVTKEIYQNIEEFVSLMNETFGEDKRFFVSLHQAGNWLDKTAENFKEHLLTKSIYREMLKRLMDKKIYINNPACNMLDPGGVVCYAAYNNSFVITSTGDIQRCTLLFHDANNSIGGMDDNKKLIMSKNKSAKWVGDLRYCKELDECKYAPCCLGDHCPATRLELIDCDKEQCRCPVTVEAIDLIIQMLDKGNRLQEIGIAEMYAGVTV